MYVKSSLKIYHLHRFPSFPEMSGLESTSSTHVIPFGTSGHHVPISLQPFFIIFIPDSGAALRLALRVRAENQVLPWSSQGVLIGASVSRFEVEKRLHGEPSLNRLPLRASQWCRELQSELLQENDEHVERAPPEVRLSSKTRKSRWQVGWLFLLILNYMQK